MRRNIINVSIQNVIRPFVGGVNEMVRALKSLPLLWHLQLCLGHTGNLTQAAHGLPASVRGRFTPISLDLFDRYSRSSKWATVTWMAPQAATQPVDTRHSLSRLG